MRITSRAFRPLFGRRILMTLAVGLFSFLAGPLRLPAEDAWWMTPQRMIQTNLREIDARMDLDAYIQTLKTYRANVVLFNVGGIVANYPTDLPFHFRNPNLENDLTGEVLRRLHDEGIRMIGRFDFSKVNEAIAKDHPDWLYVSEQGRTVTYNGQVHTCLNGPYQQDCLFQILGEAIDRYELDGIFFNMIGYVQSDYSGNEYGICQCENCRRRFREMYDLDLPKHKDPADPIYAKYEEFCRRTVDDQFLRVQSFVKAKRPGLAVCTYTTAGVDITRMESNTPLGEGTYADSDKAKGFRLLHPDRMLANTAVHFFHYPHRHSAVSPFLTQRRLLQHLFNGTWVDFYCIGPLQALEDRTVLDVLADVYPFHADNEPWLLRTREVADAGLAVDGVRPSDEFEGLYKILAESHVSFDLVSLETSDLDAYPLLIVPVSGSLDEERNRKLDLYVSHGGRLLMTGPVPAGLRCTGLLREGNPLRREKGTYLRIDAETKSRLRQPVLDKLDLVFLDGDLKTYETGPDVEHLLRYIPPAMFGPPEKCYYTEVSDIPGLYAHRFGQGAAVVFPWPVGEHYQRQGHPGHAALVTGAIRSLLEAPARVEVDASPLVEINHRAGVSSASDGTHFEWVSLLNHSGLLDNVLHEPLPIHGITVRVKPLREVTAVRLLKAKQEIEFQRLESGWLSCTVPVLSNYEVVLFEE